MWAISIHHTIINSSTAGLYCSIKRSTFSSKALPNKIFWLRAWDCSCLQEDLNHISSWADKWQLKLNANKCEALLISRKHSTPKFDYHNKGIPLFWKPLVRYLGIHINCKPDWTDHCKVITAKATRCLNFLRHSMWSAPCSAKSLAYQSIIRPIMEYGCKVWNPYQLGNISMLERIQRRAARWSCGSRWNPITLSWSKSLEVCLRELLWPTLQLRQQYFSILTLYDILHKRCPLNFSHYCTLSRTSTRTHSLALVPTQSFINAYRYSFFVNIAFLWNSIPFNILSLDSVKEFRHSLGSHLFCNCS